MYKAWEMKMNMLMSEHVKHDCVKQAFSVGMLLPQQDKIGLNEGRKKS